MMSREARSQPHRSLAFAALLALVIASLAGCDAEAEGEGAATASPAVVNVPPDPDLPNPYETLRDWGELPGDREWGQVSGIGIDPDGRHVWVADRCGLACVGTGLPSILKFDPSGTIVTSFGEDMLVRPHGLHVDEEGNVWVTDVRAAREDELEGSPTAARKGHAVFKFSPEGEVLLTLGTPGEEGNPPERLTQPNDIVTMANGDVLVAEGHSSQGPVGRISRFSSDGEFIESWGGHGTGPGEFRTPHALALDSEGRVFVADRGNNRIQILDSNGEFLDEWGHFGRPNDVFIDGDVLYAVDSESDADRNPGFRRGIYIGSAVDGDLHAFIPPHPLDPVQYSHRSDVPYGTAAEGIAIDAEGTIYAAEVVVYGLTKYPRR